MITELEDFNIKAYNTFGMNVKCRKWIEYTDADDIPSIVESLHDVPYMAIGAGSNLLFTGNFKGSLLHSRILDIEISHNSDVCLVTAGAGITMDDLILQTVKSGFWGMENLSGIPGEVGSAAVQNVGAYGVEAKDIIESVKCYDIRNKNFVEFSTGELAYGYRTSLFKSQQAKGRYIITNVTFRLSHTPAPVLDYGHVRDRIPQGADLSPALVRELILQMRKEKLPDVEKYGSAGSFFKNPIVSTQEYNMLLEKISVALGEGVEPPHFNMPEGIKVPAAWLIDKAGLKGFSLGNAATWKTQPLVIVNANGNASPDEILSLENHIVETVENKFGIVLTPEVEHI